METPTEKGYCATCGRSADDVLYNGHADHCYPTPPPAALVPERIDVEAMRANLHATFNGGWQDPETIRAFHHGMDTVCNVLNAHQLGDGTNGILPPPARAEAPEGAQE
jgi:NMD protein affecting ribosome stability and mRNA decay